MKKVMVILVAVMLCFSACAVRQTTDSRSNSAFSPVKPSVSQPEVSSVPLPAEEEVIVHDYDFHNIRNAYALADGQLYCNEEGSVFKYNIQTGAGSLVLPNTQFVWVVEKQGQIYGLFKIGNGIQKWGKFSEIGIQEEGMLPTLRKMTDDKWTFVTEGETGKIVNLETGEIYEGPRCDNTGRSAYNLFVSPWPEIDDINYHETHPPGGFEYVPIDLLAGEPYTVGVISDAYPFEQATYFFVSPIVENSRCYCFYVVEEHEYFKDVIGRTLSILGDYTGIPEQGVLENRHGRSILLKDLWLDEIAYLEGRFYYTLDDQPGLFCTLYGVQEKVADSARKLMPVKESLFYLDDNGMLLSLKAE